MFLQMLTEAWQLYIKEMAKSHEKIMKISAFDIKLTSSELCGVKVEGVGAISVDAFEYDPGMKTQLDAQWHDDIPEEPFCGRSSSVKFLILCMSLLSVCPFHQCL